MKTIMLVLLLSSAAMAKELEIQCVEIQSVTGQPFFECAQPDDNESYKIKHVETADRSIVERGLRWQDPPVLPPPFETPSWVPNEETKKRALLRGYELNGNSMCCGSIDVSDDPIVTGRTVITPETEFNVLDAAKKKKKN